MKFGLIIISVFNKNVYFFKTLIIIEHIVHKYNNGEFEIM